LSIVVETAARYCRCFKVTTKAARGVAIKLERQSTYAPDSHRFRLTPYGSSRGSPPGELVPSFDVVNLAFLQRPRLAWAPLRRIDRVVTVRTRFRESGIRIVALLME
jgi:hypothetical protein